MKVTKRCGAILLLMVGAIALAGQLSNYSRYYEKDAWYDISEWFDGNNYNPTDEAWWRWDDESYQATKDTAGDRDNDGWYGYLSGDRDRWFYDYYDPYPYGFSGYNDDLYGYGSRYYDYDNDGLYDALATYYDRDRDGIYEDYNYFSFTDKSSDKQRKRAKDQATRTSREAKVAGSIQKTKTVQVRGGKKHMVVSIEPKDPKAEKGKTVIADLGRVDELKDVNLKAGNSITVRGPRAQVGDHQVVLAKSIEFSGKTIAIDRRARNLSGKIVSTHKTKIRGAQHLIAMVETEKKGKSHRIAVDLGQADQLKLDLNKGSSLSFSGFPIMVNNKQLVMAQTVQANGQDVQIDRRMSMAGAQDAKKQP